MGNTVVSLTLITFWRDSFYVIVDADNRYKKGNSF